MFADWRLRRKLATSASLNVTTGSPFLQHAASVGDYVYSRGLPCRYQVVAVPSQNAMTIVPAPTLIERFYRLFSWFKGFPKCP